MAKRANAETRPLLPRRSNIPLLLVAARQRTDENLRYASEIQSMACPGSLEVGQLNPCHVVSIGQAGPTHLCRASTRR